MVNFGGVEWMSGLRLAIAKSANDSHHRLNIGFVLDPNKLYSLLSWALSWNLFERGMVICWSSFVGSRLLWAFTADCLFDSASPSRCDSRRSDYHGHCKFEFLVLVGSALDDLLLVGWSNISAPDFFLQARSSCRHALVIWRPGIRVWQQLLVV